MKYRAFVSDGNMRRELYRGSGGDKAIELAAAAGEALALFKLTGRVYVEEYQKGHPAITWQNAYEYGKPVPAVLA